MSHHIKSLFNHFTTATTTINHNNTITNNANIPHQTPQTITKQHQQEQPTRTVTKKFSSINEQTNRQSKHLRTRRRLLTTPTHQNHPTTTTTDSGLETSCSSNCQQTIKKLKCKCVTCSNRFHIAKRLRQAYLRVKSKKLNSTSSSSSSHLFYAHIPLLVVKSYRPPLKASFKLIEIKKNTPVNALFMMSKWIYVKTSEDLYGFIPRKCCQPFDASSLYLCCNRVNLNRRANTSIDHTYASIGDLDLKMNIVNKNDDQDFDNMSQTDLSLFMVSQIEANTSLSEHDNKTTIANSNCDYYNNNEEENYEFLPNLASKKLKSSYIDLRDVMTKTPTPSPSTQIIYECLNELKSSNSYDYLNGCHSLPKPPMSTSNNNHYDILMTYKSTRSNCDYVNLTPLSFTSTSSSASYSPQYSSSSFSSPCSSSSYSTPHTRMNLFKVIKEYEASFKGDLSVNKGDLVYLIDQTKNSEKKNDKEWACVRLYRRMRFINNNNNGRNLNECILKETNIYENLNDLKQLQGYVPRGCFVKV